MDLATLRQQVADHGYNDITNSEIDAGINIAYFEICGASSWPFLEEGPSTLAIGANTRNGQLENLVNSNSSQFARSNSRVLGVTYNGIELGAMSSEDYFAYAHALPTGSSSPTHYTVYANRLYVTPMPSAGVSVDVRFLKAPARLTLDGDEPIFPVRYHQLIVYGAVAVLAGEDDDDGLQTRFRELLTKGLEQMKADLMVKTDGRNSFFGAPGSLNFWTNRLHTAGYPKIAASDTFILLTDTIQDICSRYAWPFLRAEATLTTVANQADVALPADCVRPLGMYLYERGNQINYVSLADQRFDHNPSNSDSAGTPERYSIMPDASTFPARNTKAVLWPAPDRAYSIKLLYERRIAPSAATPNTPINWPGPGMVLELGLLYRAALREPSKESQSRLGTLKAEYEQAIELMRNDYLIEQRDRDPVVRITQTDLWDY